MIAHPGRGTLLLAGDHIENAAAAQGDAAIDLLPVFQQPLLLQRHAEANQQNVGLAAVDPRNRSLILSMAGHFIEITVLHGENAQSRKMFLQDGGTFFRASRFAAQEEKTEIMPGRETAQVPQPIGVGDPGRQALSQDRGGKDDPLAVAEVDRGPVEEIAQPGLAIGQVGEMYIYVGDDGVAGLPDYLQDRFHSGWSGQRA